MNKKITKKGFLMQIREILDGVFLINKRLFTKSLSPGKTFYKEKTIKIKGIEFRQWNVWKSKIGAAIKNGLKEWPFKKGKKILYLGSGEGQTISFLSDIIGRNGIIIGIDISASAIQKLMILSKGRQNIIPLLENAANPRNYFNELKEIEFDVIVQDIAQKNQIEIAKKNAELFLKKNKVLLIVLKMKSISSVQKEKKLLKEELNKLKEFKIKKVISLQPFEKNHYLIYCIKK